MAGDSILRQNEGMRKKGELLIYTPKTLIPGYKIESELKGFYVGVPDKGYKGNAFVIRYWYEKVAENGEKIYGWVEKKVPDWNRGKRFRNFMDRWGRGKYTLAYFKVADTL